MALATAPYITTYASRTPYISVDDYKNAATGVDVSQLVPRAGSGQQDEALTEIIARASSWADNLCYQVLAATTDIDPPQRYRVDRWGRVRVPLRFKPVLEIDAVSVGLTPSLMRALDATAGADIAFLGSTVVEIPVLGVIASSPQTVFPGPFGIGVGSRPLVQVTYVNGYPNTTLAAQAAAGATSIPVGSQMGIYAGTVLTVYDGVNTEQVTAQATPTGTTVTLTAGLANAHQAGVMVSALPPAVRQAVISLTSCLIKQRGSEAIVMSSVRGGPQEKTALEAGGMEDFEVAVDLLDPFVRVV